MIEICCPNCGIHGDLELFLASEDGLAVARLMASLPPTHVRPVMAYLRLFNPPKKRMALKKVVRLLDEVSAYIKAGEFSRDRVLYSANESQWLEGLHAVLSAKNLSLPLDGHGYLLAVMVGLARQGSAAQVYQAEALVPSPSKTRQAMQKLLGQS